MLMGSARLAPTRSAWRSGQTRARRASTRSAWGSGQTRAAAADSAHLTLLGRGGQPRRGEKHARTQRRRPLACVDHGARMRRAAFRHEVGNPLTEDCYDYKGIAEYAWSHAVVSDEVYKDIKENCDFKTSNWTDGCNTAMTVVFDQYYLIDIYNIYVPKCLLDLNSSSSASRAFFANRQDTQFGRQRRLFSGYDPCYSSYAQDYFNRKDVVDCFQGNIKSAVTPS